MAAPSGRCETHCMVTGTAVRGINDRVRLGVIWEDGAYDVEIVDYHQERKGKK